MWKKQRSPPGSTATTVALVWARVIGEDASDIETRLLEAVDDRRAEDVFSDNTRGGGSRPSFAIAMPVLQTLPPVVSSMFLSR